MAVRKRDATYADLDEVPDNFVAEILDGDLIVSPRPAIPHAHTSTALGSDLFGSFGRPPGDRGAPGGWWLLFEPELHLGPDVIVPDVAGWRRERLPMLPDAAAFVLAPDWACEVISPSTGMIDRSRKLRIYAREGVRHLWIVDPLLRTLEAYRLRDTRWVVGATHAGSERVRVEPFDAVELELERWWPFVEHA